ncbi:MAG: NusG domain II-containing protein [Bacillota bacterium]
MSKVFELMTIYDWILIIVILLLGTSILLFPFWRSGNENNENQHIFISVDGEVVEKIPIEETIDESHLFEVEGPIGTSVIEAKDGRVRMKSSPCHEKICENAGWIERAGPTIICVPNEISIWIKSESSDLDGTTW